MLELLAPSIVRTPTADGVVLASTTPLPAPARSIGSWLVRWAKERPDAPFLSERDVEGGFRTVRYGEALRVVESIGSALLARGAEPTRPLMILSENSVDAALLGLSAMHVGVPVATVSSAYSLLSTTFGRLKSVAAQLGPGFVFADDPQRYGHALAALSGVEVISSGDLARMADTPRSDALLEAFSRVGPETIAKVLFTSGSTGTPKGVVNTHRMLTANQESLASCWPFVNQRPPVVVDWLPWSHTFGANHNFNMVLRNGGHLTVDRGRPAPGLVEITLRNMADVGPTMWVNVPRGFDQALHALEHDEELARRVFANVDLVFYAAAALNPSTRARLRAVAEAAGRPDVFFTSAWGSTETSPLATSAHFPTETVGILGVPVPGVRLKLARVNDLLELRVQGPNVTPGYWSRGGAIEPVKLDEDGFLPTGDAGRLVDEGDPSKGVRFGGRIGENFKLSSGTWVNVGAVRLGVVDACAPLVLDAVVCGHDRDYLAVLLFLSPAAKAHSADEVRSNIATALAAYDRSHTGASERVASALILDTPLSLDDGETTDKGYTNQRRVLERRWADVARLFADELDEDVLVIES